MFQLVDLHLVRKQPTLVITCMHITVPNMGVYVHIVLYIRAYLRTVRIGVGILDVEYFVYFVFL